MNAQNSSDECCPKFDPAKWDEKEFNWDGKPFIKETIPTLFHIPFPPMIGKKINNMMKSAQDSDAVEENKSDMLILFHDPGAFKSEIFMSVKAKVSNADNTPLTGSFIGKVYSGGYNAVPKFIKETDEYLAAKGRKAKDYYIHYAYCPKCAEKFGDNYMILFAKL